MLKDYFAFAFGSFSHRKLRSWLTMIGIFIGIAAVVALISLGRGFDSAVRKEFEKIGTDKLFVTAKQGFGPPGTNAAVQLTDDDLDVILRVPGIVSAAGLINVNTKVTFKDAVGFLPIYSIPKGDARKLLEETESLAIETGRNLRDSDTASALIGINLATRELFEKNLKVRDKIFLGDTEFTIVGIQKKTGDPVWDNSIFIPEDTLREVFSEPKRLDMVMVKVASVENIDLISERVANALRNHRDVKKEQEDFEIQTPDDILASFGEVLTIINIVLIGIAAISLVVGGIGIANTMYTAVVERTKEIGIMKSIGAKKSDITLIFIIESGLLGVIGGLIGVVIGLSLSFSVAVIAKTVFGTNLIEAYISLPLVLGALLFSFVLGSVFGVLPARKAAALHPVNALKFK